MKSQPECSEHLINIHSTLGYTSTSLHFGLFSDIPDWHFFAADARIPEIWHRLGMALLVDFTSGSGSFSFSAINPLGMIRRLGFKFACWRKFPPTSRGCSSRSVEICVSGVGPDLSSGLADPRFIGCISEKWRAFCDVLSGTRILFSHLDRAKGLRV